MGKVHSFKPNEDVLDHRQKSLCGIQGFIVLAYTKKGVTCLRCKKLLKRKRDRK